MIRKKPGTGYNNNPALRAARDTHEYTPAELQEMLHCATDVQYFAENYCYIITLDGKQKISLYDYQKDLLDVMLNGKPEEDKYNTIVLSPRQCISTDTIVTINGKDTTAGEFHLDREIYVNIVDPVSDKFTSSVKLVADHYIEGPSGRVRIEYVHATVPFKKYKLELSNGYTLSCAAKHMLIGPDYIEIFAEDSLGKEVLTNDGLAIVVKVEFQNYSEPMIDFSLDSIEELYYANGILSHNSGKCATGDSKITVRNKITKEAAEITMKDFFDNN